MMKLNTLARLFGLDGKVAVVTDAGSLASVDVVPALADAGATVVVADKDPAATQALAERIARDGGEALAVPTDVESETEVLALFRAVRERFGRLDILVNCAGVIANQPFVEATLDQFDSVVSTNLRSVFLCMREGVRLMLEGGQGGRIINVTTIGSLHPVLHGNQIYGATRAGVTMLTRTTAMDHLADRILANVVLPGAVQGKTAFHQTTQAALAAGRGLKGPGVERNSPLGMLDSQDIGAAVLYLAGPSGGYITGQSIVLDGGFLTM